VKSKMPPDAVTGPSGKTLVPVVDPRRVPTLLRVPGPDDDKYSRGVLAMVTGSLDYPGAALLGVSAAIHTGVGMVRYLGPQAVADMVMMNHPEVVVGPGRMTAAVVGSGWPETTKKELEKRLAGVVFDGIPVVLDAWAMVHREVFQGPAVLTPHRGELARLVEAFDAPEADPAAQALWLAEKLDATVVLKGHQTLVVSPDNRRSILPEAPTWLATAGTGDVLAGVMGAVLTSVQVAHPGQSLGSDDCHDVAVVAALIHQEAARVAARVTGGGTAPFGAGELARCVREAVVGFMAP
jgi:hydroxyethylthiazole kinase-like uncharacterized protein yjeF